MEFTKYGSTYGCKSIKRPTKTVMYDAKERRLSFVYIFKNLSLFHGFDVTCPRMLPSSYYIYRINNDKVHEATVVKSKLKYYQSYYQSNYEKSGHNALVIKFLGKLYCAVKQRKLHLSILILKRHYNIFPEFCRITLPFVFSKKYLKLLTYP